MAELARRADTSPATLSRYENGWTRFETYTLKKLATALDCDLHIEFRPINVDRRVRRSAGISPEKQWRRLFWDRPLAAGDLRRYPVWVAERILDYGNLDDVRALRRALGRRTFLATIALASRVSPRTRVFWRQILEKEGVACTKKFSRPAVWTY